MCPVSYVLFCVLTSYETLVSNVSLSVAAAVTSYYTSRDYKLCNHKLEHKVWVKHYTCVVNMYEANTHVAVTFVVNICE